jgi:phosphatidylinositol 3-kinase
LNDTNGETPEDGMKNEHEEKFYIHIEFPRFDHPIVFTDQEYPAPPISSIQLPASSSEVRLKPPPEVSFGPGINVDGNGYGDVDAGRLVRIYDPEVGMRDNPAENKHRRLVRSHRTGVLDRDLKPNAKIRDELNVRISHEANTILLQKLILRTGYHVLWSHS